MPLQFEVIHDDGDLLIVNKPFGLPVMPAGGFLEHTLLRLLEQCCPVDPPRPVHRLGRGTSGLLILCAPGPEPRLAQCGPATPGDNCSGSKHRCP